MFKWGNVNLKVKKGTYQAPFPLKVITELNIIPGINGETLSAIQGGSRNRKKPSMRIKLETMAEYKSLYDDYILSRQDTFKDVYNNEITAMILSLGVPEEIAFKWIECDIQFIEV